MSFDTPDYQSQRFFPASVEDKLVGLMSRAAGAALLAVVALAWISLASWTTHDPSLTLATSGPVQNMAGAPGAILADLLLQMLGLGAVFALFAPMFWGLELVRVAHVTSFRSKVAFYPLSVIVFAGALSALPAMASWPLDHGYGGILGDFVFGMVSGVFSALNPERAALATGFLLAAIGLSTLMHSLGLELRDLYRILFQPIRRVNWREKAGSWQHTLLSEAKRVRDTVRDSLEPQDQYPGGEPGVQVRAAGMEAGADKIDRGADKVSSSSTEPKLEPTIIRATSHPESPTVEMDGRRSEPVARTHPTAPTPPHQVTPGFVPPQQQAAMAAAPHYAAAHQGRQPTGFHPAPPASAPGLAYNTWLRPTPPHPMAPRATGPAPAPHPQHFMPRHHQMTQRTSAPPTAAMAASSLGHMKMPPHPEQRPHLPATTPHPISSPNDMQSVARQATPSAQHTPTAPNAGKAEHVDVGSDKSKVAQQFAAHIANGASATSEPEGDEDAQSSREMARRFAPAAAQSENKTAPSGPQQRAGTDTAQKAGSVVPPLMGSNVAPAPRSQKRRYQLPSSQLLARAKMHQALEEQSPDCLRQRAEELQTVLSDFGIKGAIKNIRPGPVVTLYEFEPARGIKSSRVIALADDIARSMSAISARVAVVPGRNAIGIELPNSERRPVVLRELIDANAYRGSSGALPLTLGKSIGGEAVVADLARMPHLLVAGTTGSGKSVGVNAMVLSILYKHSPETCRLLMIDPKMLELSVYNDIPHLLSPVITDPQKAVVALNWAVREMEERYKRMSKLSVRNIGVYNNRVRHAKKRGENLSRTVHTGFDTAGQAVYENETMQLDELPHIVIVVDEFADLMLVAGKDIEAAIQRLAQMARAAGIHLIMATQRPSVDVITGTIKANFPTRISFKVTSKVDSRTILNEQGAEQLLGQGDMLYASGSGQTMRVHGPFVSDEEVEAIAAHLKSQGAPDYVAQVTEAPEPAPEQQSEKASSEADLYDQAVQIVLRDRKASTSYIQRRLSIGYNRAANLIEQMEEEGVIGPAGAGGKREILKPVEPRPKAEDAA